MRQVLKTALAAALLLVPGSAAEAADPDALWKIVHERCVVDQRQNGKPSPCAQVDLAGDGEAGFAVLKDIVGETQFLLIPTARIGGIESPAILAPDAPNYFAAAWEARRYVEERAHRALPRDAISLAVNSAVGRSQSQLHIHIDCIRADIRDLLIAHQDEIGEAWAPLAVPLAGHRYSAMRVAGAELGERNPFRLLAEGLPGAQDEMRSMTLVVVGMGTAAGAVPSFLLLADRANPALGDFASGEELQDHLCELARR